MMNSQRNDYLFELIKNLNKTEKRYFKVFSSRHVIGKENNYIVLFDFMLKMDEYDEALIFKKFKGDDMLNRFSITKQRLYQSILKSLDAFYAESSPESNLYKLIHSAEILYRKALYNQCKKVLKSAEKLAIKHEKYHILLEIDLKLKKLIENNGYMENSIEDIDRILKNDTKYVNIIQNYCQIWNVKSKLFYQMNKYGVARSPAERTAYDDILSPIKSLTEQNDFESRYLTNHTKAAYYFAIDDTVSSLNEINKNIALFQKNSTMIKNEPNLYFSTLTNAIYSHNQCGEYEKAHEYLQLLKKMPEQLTDIRNEDLDIKLFSSINSIELNFLNFQGNFCQSTKLEPIIEEGFRLYGNKISTVRRAYLGFSLSVAFYGKGDLNKALRWTNYILNEAALDHKEDIFSYAQLFNLVIHFELNHQQLLPYALKNTQRYLKSRNKLYAFEQVFLKYISKINNTPQKVNQLDLLLDVATSLENLRKNPYERNVFNYFDFAAWAYSKAYQTSYAELLQKRYQERLK